MVKFIRGNTLGDGVGDTQCPRRAAQAPLAHGRHMITMLDRPARHRVRRARQWGRRYRRGLRVDLGTHRAHGRHQLLVMGVRWMRGVFDGEGPLAPMLLATPPYADSL